MLILAHWEEILRPFLLGAFVFVPAGIASVYGLSLLMTLPMMAMKAGWLRHNKGAWKIILIYSVIVAVIAIPILVVGRVNWRSFLQSSYVSNYSWVWIGLGVAILFLLLFSYITKNGNTSEFLHEFKAIPFASPVFCFGAPAFWTKSLLAFGLSSNQIKIAGAVSFFCGVLFIAGLIIHYVTRNTAEDSSGAPGVILESEHDRPSEPEVRPNRLETIALGSTLVASAGFVFVVLQLAMGILTKIV